ncbi:hypothetical protein [Mucilaginibacter sp.]|uniref:hypothetical protein n=1 Tax=Mucilaginibacter sp. TaxID=1882438 RepID=UPI0032652029
MRKLIIISAIALAGLITGVVVINNTHPILLSLALGTARSLGKPIPASVYTDGRLDKGILVYRDKDNGYVLSLKDFDNDGMLHYIQIHTKENWVGRPVGSNIECYDVIGARLIQSEVGQNSVDFKDDMKGFDMDPHLTVAGNTIAFTVPYRYLKYNMIKVALN